MFSFAENFENPSPEVEQMFGFHTIFTRTNVRKQSSYNRFFRLINSLIVYTIMQLCNNFIQEKTPDFFVRVFVRLSVLAVVPC